MLQIKCDHCNAILKGKDIIITPFNNYIADIKYKDYATTCPKCGGAVVLDRCVKMGEKNKEKAMIKLARKKGQSVAQINEAKQYNTIMHKLGKQIPQYPEGRFAQFMHLNRLVDELPADQKRIVLEYEDKQDIALLHKENHKSTDIDSNSILLLTQGIIEFAIADNDEDFFRSKYGQHIVDVYNTALTLHTRHDYKITAELLLEKMRKGEITLNTDEMRRIV